MEQRPLRLGDLVDDYCPRERRVTNHAIVAIVNDGIRQTRCTTCDTEHVFKGAKAPRRRKKDDEGGLPALPEAEEISSTASAVAPVEVVPAIADTVEPPAAMAANGSVVAQREEVDANEAGPARPEDNVWFVHRPLIRAQLPRTENDQPPSRPIPEFTMHQRHGRGSRDGHGWSNRDGNVNGNTAHGNGHGRSQGFRGPGGRPPFGQGGQDQGAGRRRHGRKRPR